nr:MAG TPA: FN3 [Caudoviricetes sp.]
MATVYGPWVTNEYNFRAILDYSTSVAADKVYVYLTGRSQSGQAVINYGKSVLEYTEDGSNFTNMANVYPSALGYGQTVANSSANDWWTRFYGRDRSIYIQHWFSSPGSSRSDYVTGSRAGVNITIPARDYEYPKAPLSPSVVRNSDSSMTLAWAANYTGSNDAYPWTGLNVYRSVDGGSWVSIAQLSWDKVGYTDETTAAGHKYEYMVRSYNPTGESGNAVCGTVYTTPTAPKSASVIRVSDTSQTVSWVRGSNADNCWTGVSVERQTDGGSWVSVYSGDTDGTSWSDVSTTAGHAYAYQVRGKNPSGTSEAATAGTVYTTPSAPSGVTASAASETTATIDAAGKPKYADSYEIQRKTTGDWGSSTTVTCLPATVATSAGSNTFRVRAKKGNLTSEWAVSNSITTVAKPLAPTITGLSSRYLVGGSAPFGWNPNHPDGSAQTQAQIGAVAPDGVEYYSDVKGSVTTYTIKKLSAGIYKVRVRTHGLYDGWGEWSSYSTFEVFAAPNASITSPATEGETIDRLPLGVTWGADDSTGIQSQLLELLSSSGEVLYSTKPASTARSASIGVRDYQLANGTTYSLRLTVTAGSSFSATATRTFKTRWTAPAAPILSWYHDDDLAAHVTVRFGTEEGAPATSYVSLMRFDGDGNETLLASSAGDNSVIVDRLPPLGTSFRYRATSYTDYGVTGTNEVECLIEADALVVNWGDDAGQCEVFTRNLSENRSISYDAEVMFFADGGETGGLPVAYPLDNLTQSGTFSFATLTRGEFEAARRIVRQPVIWIRYRWGQVFRAYATLSASEKNKEVYEWSLKFQRVAWREPTRG